MLTCHLFVSSVLAVSFLCQLCAKDDRFIMKQIKAVEISSFEQIAPH